MSIDYIFNQMVRGQISPLTPCILRDIVNNQEIAIQFATLIELIEYSNNNDSVLGEVELCKKS